MNQLLSLLLIFCVLPISAQDLSRIGSGKIFSHSANLTMAYNGVASSQDSLVDQSDIYLIHLRGNFEVLGFSVPLQFTYRKGQFQASTQNPFIRFGISPTYKWLKIHAGYRNMLFSRYSLNDVTFLGGGFEINPGIFRLAAMYGELRPPNYNLDSLALHADLISDYKRIAHGIKVGIGKEKTHFDLYYLKGRDHYQVADSEEIYVTKLPPSENLVAGTDIRILMFKKLQAGCNVNISIMTGNQLNTSDTLEDDASQKLLDIASNFMTTNLTTRANLAGDASLQWLDRYFNIGVLYKRVDPEYQSFGIHYVLDDLESLTLNGALRLYKSRVTLNGQFGIQHTNINNLRKNTSERIVYSVNANFLLKSAAGLSLNYSNFAIDQQAGYAALNDTFRFVQNTSVFNASPFLRFGKDDVKYMVNFTYNQSQVRDLSPFAEARDLAQMQAQVLSFRTDYTQTDWSWSVSVLRNLSDFQEINSQRIGGSLQIGKKFSKPDWQCNARAGYNKLKYQFEDDGYALNASLSSSVRVQKHLSLQCLLSYLDKAAVRSRAYDEWRFTVSLSYDFFQSKSHGQ